MSDKEFSLSDDSGVDPRRWGRGVLECGWYSGRDLVTSEESVTDTFSLAVDKVVPEGKDNHSHSELWLLSYGKKLQMT